MSNDTPPQLSAASISYDSYQGMAEYYYTEVDTKPFNAYYERPATLSLLPEVCGKNVLDAGCAAGWYSQWFIEHNAAVTAIDFSPNMVEMTKKRVGERAKVIRADLNEPLTFLGDMTMDIIMSSLTLHYLKNWAPVLAEFHRILKKRGELIFSVHHPFMDYTVFKRDNYFLTELLDDEWDTSIGKVKLQFYRRPLHEIISPVLAAGFELHTLLEPIPTAEFHHIHPQAYEKLAKNPHFLFIKAIKK